VPHVQKGAVLIVNDQSAARIAASFLTVIFALSFGAPVLADSALPTAAAADASSLTDPLAVTLLSNGTESSFSTQARTVADLLAERGIRFTMGDSVAPPLGSPLENGTRVVYRSAQAVQLRVGPSISAIRSTAGTVGELLRDEHVALGPRDEVSPSRLSRLYADEVVRVVRVRIWTARERIAIAPKLVRRSDPALLPGKTKTLASGTPGVRETTVRYTRRDDDAPTRMVLQMRIVREPQARVVASGGVAYAALARVAAQGFASAVHMAGSALHMIATAYSAACYGCSGVTASGVRAGFGIVAVDPSVIPLGTKVFIPGYGRAVAGDTGGAILGHRIDLGFDSEIAARRFGRRPITLYVLR